MKNTISNSDKIFIAGANGMVGSAIKRSLFKYVRSNYLSIDILCPSKLELNLLDKEEVNKWFIKNKPSIVILAAAKVGGIFANSKYPADFLLNNLLIETNVIESAWRHDVKRLVFLGSSCIYPKFAAQPIREEFLLNGYLESTNECYAIAKIAGLKLCESLRSQYGFDAISVMPTNLYGPNDNYHPQNSHVMAAIIRKFVIAKFKSKSSVSFWGSGSVFREFLHVDDLAEAIIFCIENWHPSDDNSPRDSNGRILNHLNIGTGKDITIKELVSKIAKLTSYKGEILWDSSKPDGTPKKLLDVSRINNLGWKAKIKLDSGIKQTINNLDISSLLNFKD